jgi:ABC-2 type transport system permease protein
MFQLLKIEWMKVKNYRTFWIFLALYILGLVGINYIAYQLQFEIKKTNLPIELFPYNFPRVYQTIAWVSSWLLYFPGMLMILIISNEYAYKTHRQNIIDGLTRKQFVIAKILFATILAIFTTLICLLISFGFGLAFSGSFSFDGMQYIGYSFIQSLSYLFFAMIVAILFRRSGLAIAIFFLYGLIFEQMIGGLMDNKILNGPYFWYYMPLQASDVLIPITFGNNIIYKNAPSTTTLILVCAFYIVLYNVLSLRKFDTEDL